MDLPDFKPDLAGAHSLRHWLHKVLKRPTFILPRPGRPDLLLYFEELVSSGIIYEDDAARLYALIGNKIGLKCSVLSLGWPDRELLQYHVNVVQTEAGLSWVEDVWADTSFQEADTGRLLKPSELVSRRRSLHEVKLTNPLASTDVWNVILRRFNTVNYMKQIYNFFDVFSLIFDMENENRESLIINELLALSAWSLPNRIGHLPPDSEFPVEIATFRSANRLGTLRGSLSDWSYSWILEGIRNLNSRQTAKIFTQDKARWFDLMKNAPTIKHEIYDSFSAISPTAEDTIVIDICFEKIWNNLADFLGVLKSGCQLWLTIQSSKPREVLSEIYSLLASQQCRPTNLSTWAPCINDAKIMNIVDPNYETFWEEKEHIRYYALGVKLKIIS